MGTARIISAEGGKKGIFKLTFKQFKNIFTGRPRVVGLHFKTETGQQTIQGHLV
jgi:hypothetical protein